MDDKNQINPRQGLSIPIGTLLEKVVDDLLEGFQIINNEWKYLYVNNTACKQGRRKKEELLGKTMKECYPGIDSTPFFKNLESCMVERKSLSLETDFTFPNGSVGWFLLHIHPAGDREVLIFSFDITERKTAEAKLQEKIKEIQELINATVDRELQMTQLKEEVQKLKLLAELPIQVHPVNA